MERSGRSEAETGVPTLADLCCVSLAKAISEGYCSQETLSNLPGELSERLLRSLSAQSMLNNESLLCAASPHLRSLDVSNMKQRASHPDEVGIRDALKICNSLEELNCHGCTIDDNVLTLIHSSAFSPSLKLLDLSSCSGVTTCGLREILLKCTRLEYLNLSGCSITDESFDLLEFRVAGLPSPEKGLKRKFECGPGDSCPLPSFEALQERSSCKRVKREVHQDMEVYVPPPSVETSYPQPLVYLRSLNISGCRSLTNRGLFYISKLFPYLTRLDCSHIDTNENLDIRPILTGCPFIKSLNLNGCKLDQSEPFIANPGVALEEISFCGTGTLNTNFYDLLLHCAKTFRVVRLRNKVFSDLEDGRARDPTDWLNQCHALTTLDLYSVSVGESALAQLLSTHCRETLEVLDITHCHIPERDLRLLCSTYLPRLRSLSLNHVVIAQWTMELGNNCPLLSHLCLNLDLKALLPERDVPQLLSGLSNLRELELWCCKSLSRPTVLSILETCPDLRCLLLSTANSEERIEDEDIELGDDEDSEWSEEEEIDKNQGRNEAKVEHQHHHGHCHAGDNAISWLTDEEFSHLTQAYPQVQFKIWHHTISGNRHFRFHNGETSKDVVDRLVSPLKVNEIGVRLKIQARDNGPQEIVPMILVDNIPIWSHETSASLHHLRKTIDGGDGGALPLISEWCCECNIESYNGVLFYHDADYVFWETHEPGVKQCFRFSKGQYITAVNNARLQYMQLAWQMQRLRWVQQQKQANQVPLVSCI